MTSLETARELREVEEQDEQDRATAAGKAPGCTSLHAFVNDPEFAGARAALAAAYSRRRAEDAATLAADRHYFTKTFAGREAQGAYNARVRARLDETKETHEH